MNLVGQKVYVAGRTSDVYLVQLAQQRIEKEGGKITFDWTRLGDLNPDADLTEQNRDQLARAERAAVDVCDSLVLCYNDNGERSMLGALLEAGGAIWLDKRVVVLNPTRESIFWSLPRVRKAWDLDEMIVALSE